MKKWLVVGVIAGVSIAGVSLFLPRDMRHQGGSFYTTYSSSFPEAGGNIRLYRKGWAGTRVKIADRAYVMKVYPNDCALYEQGGDAGVIHAACGSRRPVRVAYYPTSAMHGGWVADDAGLRRADPARIDSNGHVVAKTETIALADIERASRDGNRVEPAVRDEPVDPHARGDRGLTPLHEAIREHARDVVQALLAAGADPNTADSAGYTPLEMAVQGLDSDVVIARMVLAAGADPCKPAQSGGKLEKRVIGNPPIVAMLQAASERCARH